MQSRRRNHTINRHLFWRLFAGFLIIIAVVLGAGRLLNDVQPAPYWTLLVGVIAAACMAVLLSWSIAKPLRQIDAAAEEIGAGNYTRRIPIDRDDEIGVLANTINTMAMKLEKVQIEREKLDRIRTDYLANVSHELRTPLTAMQGFLEILQDGLADEAASKKYYDIMYSETIHMNRLLDDIMHLIRLKNKEIAMIKYPVHVSALLKKVKMRFENAAKQKQNTLDLQLPPDDVYAYADQDRMEQILSNLIKNAINFTESGTIRIAARLENEMICFEVSDTGSGIPKEDQPYVWERFFKSDRGRSKQNSGSGLGLAIVHELVALHDGKADFVSEPGKGTCFSVWIPSAIDNDAISTN